VTPAHFIPFILKALSLAAEQGLRIPLVYNSSGYESPATLKLLDGIIDIYLPDWKYAEEGPGKLYSEAPDYPAVCRAAIKEMYRQVGDLQVDEHKIAQRGLIIRHLVLPGHLSNSEKVLTAIRDVFSDSIRVSLMSQYAPRFRAQEHPLINRPLNQKEYQEISALMERHDFEEYWIQEMESQEVFFPDFERPNPFSSSGS
jgi:putative pyruvate formate lyase activating enzyme